MFLKALRIPIVQDTNHESDLKNHLTFRQLPVLPAYTGRKRLKKKKRKKNKKTNKPVGTTKKNITFIASLHPKRQPREASLKSTVKTAT